MDALYEIRIPVLKNLFDGETVMKAAFAFIDRAYIHVTEDKTHWFVNIELKDKEKNNQIPKEFENELLVQAVRLNVYNKTHVIREIVLARAMTSSIVDQDDPIERIEAEQKDISDEELNTILKDWFDSNGK